jgi:flagellar biosynthesis protein FlhF
VLEWIGESISIYKEDSFQRKPRVMILVGPTGVGKTTTTAKLAAIYGTRAAGRQAQRVRLINIDFYRIGAMQQIENYGGIMDIPVSSARDYGELKREIALAAEDTDLILVDTIGRSPRKSVELARMKELLSACPQAEFHLVMTAYTKTSDVQEILREFDIFGYQSVIITKVDESSAPGNIISALSEKGKSVSFITTGQNVPKDIEYATPTRFLMSLEGWTINRRRLEEHFPDDKDKIFKWRPING